MLGSSCLVTMEKWASIRGFSPADKVVHRRGALTLSKRLYTQNVGGSSPSPPTSLRKGMQRKLQ